MSFIVTRTMGAGSSGPSQEDLDKLAQQKNALEYEKRQRETLERERELERQKLEASQRDRENAERRRIRQEHGS